MGIIDNISEKIGRRIIDIADKIVYPDIVDGYRINYNNVYHTHCPYHNCKTYRTWVESEYVYCPLCRKLLAVWDK